LPETGYGGAGYQILDILVQVAFFWIWCRRLPNTRFGGAGCQLLDSIVQVAKY